ncbi:taste receptor type 2 member 40-like [Gastrophryne carolinensis]
MKQHHIDLNATGFYVHEESRMTSRHYHCPSHKDSGQQIISLLLVFLLFPETAEKESQNIGLPDSNSRLKVIQQELTFSCPVYKSKCYKHPSRRQQEPDLQSISQLETINQFGVLNIYINPRNMRTLVSCPIPFQSTMFTGGLLDNFGCYMVEVCQRIRPNCDPDALVSRTWHDLHLDGHSLDVDVLYIGNVPKPSPHIMTVIILMYLHTLATRMCKGSEMLVLGKEDRQINETSDSHIVPTFVIVSLSALGMSTVVVFFTSSSIILVNGMNRLKGTNVNRRDLILSTLGLFNLAFQCTMAANDSLLFFWTDVYFLDSVYTLLSILLLFTIFSSFWLTFCLCGFYYVMLVTSEYSFLKRLKHRISDIVPWMLVSCALLSLIISVPVAWNIQKDEQLFQAEYNFTGNSTVQLGTPHMSLQYLFYASMIGCCTPLILVAITNILIIKCLYDYVKQLRNSAAIINKQSVEAVGSAARTVSCLLLLYISFYVSETLLIMDIFKMDSPWITGCLVTVYSYAPLQSLVVILGSQNLRDVIKRWLCPIKVTNHMTLAVRTDTSLSISVLLSINT